MKISICKGFTIASGIECTILLEKYPFTRISSLLFYTDIFKELLLVFVNWPVHSPTNKALRITVRSTKSCVLCQDLADGPSKTWTFFFPVRVSEFV